MYYSTNPMSQKAYKNIIGTLEEDYDQIFNIAEKKTEAIVEKIEISTPDESEDDALSTPLSKAQEFISIDTVKVSSTKLDSLINLVSELVTTQARLVNFANDSRSTELVLLSEDFQQLSRQFRDIAFDMRLIPIQTMLVKFKRLIRDLSKKLGKKVNFTSEGTETELDKNIIAKISDPIMHIIRNAIDHGIELPEDRIKNGKPETGTIHLKASYSGTYIVITIKDDGAGIDINTVLQKALDKNLVLPSDELDDKEILKLLMSPGFSTSEKVTDVSGRGVGMDVVRKKTNDLRGEVTLSSEAGKGMEVTIRLPLSLSIIDGLLVTINHDRYVIPLSSVNKIYKITKEAIDNSINNVITVEGVQFPTINLPAIFGDQDNYPKDIHFITVSYQNKVIGLVVNELLSEYQAVLKPIGKILGEQRNLCRRLHIG